MNARAILLLVLALIVGVTWVFAIVSKRFEKVLSVAAVAGWREMRANSSASEKTQTAVSGR